MNSIVSRLNEYRLSIELRNCRNIVPPGRMNALMLSTTARLVAHVRQHAERHDAVVRAGGDRVLEGRAVLDVAQVSTLGSKPFASNCALATSSMPSVRSLPPTRSPSSAIAARGEPSPMPSS